MAPMMFPGPMPFSPPRIPGGQFPSFGGGPYFGPLRMRPQFGPASSTYMGRFIPAVGPVTPFGRTYSPPGMMFSSGRRFDTYSQPRAQVMSTGSSQSFPGVSIPTGRFGTFPSSRVLPPFPAFVGYGQVSPLGFGYDRGYPLGRFQNIYSGGLDNHFDRMSDRADTLYDRIDNRLDQRGDRLENFNDRMGNYFDNRADRFDNFYDRLDNRFDDRGNRFDNMYDRIDNRYDRFGDRLDNIWDRRDDRRDSFGDRMDFSFDRVKEQIGDRIKNNWDRFSERVKDRSGILGERRDNDGFFDRSIGFSDFTDNLNDRRKDLTDRMRDRFDNTFDRVSDLSENIIKRRSKRFERINDRIDSVTGQLSDTFDTARDLLSMS